MGTENALTTSSEEAVISSTFKKEQKRKSHIGPIECIICQNLLLLSRKSIDEFKFWRSRMEIMTNAHVSRLNRYLPFSVSHDQIYEEYQSDQDGKSLDTKALQYVLNAVSSGARIIILTGDAGHGKTHLCRRLIEDHLKYQTSESRNLLLEKCDGGESIKPASGNGTPLRIHKDFSEIDTIRASRFIEEHGTNNDEALVICANEGRLRAVISAQTSGDVCGKLKKLFRSTFTTGKSSIDGDFHVVNLNFQSVASENSAAGTSLVRRAMNDWVGDGRRWATCGQCAIQSDCPILWNRLLLGDNSTSSESRMEKLEGLCATVERLGYVITIREMLMLISYIVTGGLTCQDVRDKVRRHAEPGWQSEYAFYNLLFSNPIEIAAERLFRGIPILQAIKRLDPGKIARRTVDERLLNGDEIFPTSQLDLLYQVKSGRSSKIIDTASGIDDVIGSPQSKTELQKESEIIRKIVSGLRRRSFFDETTNTVDMLDRLGFIYGGNFLQMLSGNLTPQQMVKFKNLVVAGFHGIQGLRLSSTETVLYLVDPAFGKASADAAIIARQIPVQDIAILPEHAAWKNDGGSWGLTSSVDWLDRSVVIRISDRLGENLDISLDMMAFECVARSASGFISEGFYSSEMKRVRAFLGKLAERGRSHNGQISLFMNGKVNTVSLDQGVIQVSGGA